MEPTFAALSPWVWVVAPVVVVAAYVVFGLGGFGSAVVAVPLLAHFLPVSYLVPVIVLLDIFCAAFLGGTSRHDISKAELKRLIPFMFVGFAVGATVLVGAPDRHVKVALGIFTTLIGIHGILNPVLHKAISSLWCIPAGITGGAVATVFGAGGPIYATYLSGRLKDKSQLRATISTLITLSAFSRAIVFAVTGLLLHAAVFTGMLLAAPFAWAGLMIGNRIHLGLTQEQLRRAVGAVLVCSGVGLLIRAL